MTSFKTWSDHEISYLKSNFGKLTHKQIASHLGRTELATKCMARRLGLSRMNQEWSPEDIEYLNSTYPHKPIAAIAKQLNRTEVAIKNKANRLGIPRTIAPKKPKIRPKGKKPVPVPVQDQKPTALLKLKQQSWIPSIDIGD